MEKRYNTYYTDDRVYLENIPRDVQDLILDGKYREAFKSLDELNLTSEKLTDSRFSEILNQLNALNHRGKLRRQTSAPSSDKKGCFFIFGLLLVFLSAIGGFLPKEKKPESSQSSFPSIVENHPLDGSVIPVKRYIKNNLKDPDSLNFISWGATIRNAEGNYVVSVKYRAKNSFGGYVINDQVFILNGAGQILQVNNY